MPLPSEGRRAPTVKLKRIFPAAIENDEPRDERAEQRDDDAISHLIHADMADLRSEKNANRAADLCQPQGKCKFHLQVGNNAFGHPDAGLLVRQRTQDHGELITAQARHHVPFAHARTQTR